jgi:trans-2-enoyl-CoA reductase
MEESPIRPPLQQPILSKEQVDLYTHKRAYKKHLSTTAVGRALEDPKLLDKHINEFLERIITDSERHKSKELAQHAKAFDKELTQELDMLFKRLKEDLTLLNNALKALSTYREHLSSILNNPDLTPLAESELNYADLLHQEVQGKIKTFQQLFNKLR